MTDPSRQSAHADQNRFDSTQWSLVLAAAKRSNPEADKALSILCSVYWPPLYAYIRRKGYAIPEAQDLTQAFFVRLMEKNYLQDVQRERGKFVSARMENIWQSDNPEAPVSLSISQQGKNTDQTLFSFMDYLARIH